MEMTKRQEEFVLSNKDIYVNEFAKYWHKYYDYDPEDWEFKHHFKGFMYNNYNIDYVDFRNKLWRKILFQAFDLWFKMFQNDNVNSYRDDIERRLKNKTIYALYGNKHSSGYSYMAKIIDVDCKNDKVMCYSKDNPEKYRQFELKLSNVLLWQRKKLYKIY